MTATRRWGSTQTAQAGAHDIGNLLCDPIGFVKADDIARMREHGEVVAIVASHPHLFGVKVQGSRALGDVPDLAAEVDREWIMRPDPVARLWSDCRHFNLARPVTEGWARPAHPDQGAATAR